MFENENSLKVIIEYILNTYHKPLKLNLPILGELINKIVSVHGDSHKEFFDIRKIFDKFSFEMLDHLKKEENILFPIMIEIDKAYNENKKIGPFHFKSVSNPISRMEFEHDNFEDYLKKIRNLTNDFLIPQDACNTYKKVFEMLQELENETLKHANLENKILHKLAIKKEFEIS